MQVTPELMQECIVEVQRQLLTSNDLVLRAVDKKGFCRISYFSGGLLSLCHFFLFPCFALFF